MAQRLKGAFGERLVFHLIFLKNLDYLGITSTNRKNYTKNINIF